MRWCCCNKVKCEQKKAVYDYSHCGRHAVLAVPCERIWKENKGVCGVKEDLNALINYLTE